MADFVNVTFKMFFDRAKVLDAMDRKTNRVLSSTGAFGRTVMRRGMRRRKRVSQPGEYPSAHAGQLKELVFFGFDDASNSVVIGPTLFAGARRNVHGNQTIPQLLNEGGTVVRTVRSRGGRTRRVRQQYRPRPFVGLTLPATSAKLAENMEKFDLK